MEVQNPLLDVDPETLSRLDGEGLAKVLRELVWLELNRHGISHSDAHVPLNIKARDGGIDGRVRWKGEPDPNQLDGLSFRDTAFQAKATPMGPKACKKELLDSGGDSLKSRVREALEEGAAYVLVNTKELDGDGELVDDRIEKMREAVQESGSKIDHEDAKLEVLDATGIVDWARKYPSVITLIRQLTNQLPPSGFVRWEDWEKEWTKNPEFTAKMVFPDEVNSNMKWIIDRLSEGGSVSRIVGLSGLGKPRMALESLRMPEDVLGVQNKLLLTV